MEKNLNSIAVSVKESVRTAAEGLTESLKINRNLIAAALVIACGTDEGERCAPPSRLNCCLEWPYGTGDTGDTAETGTVPSETNETGGYLPTHSGSTPSETGTTAHTGHTGETQTHTGHTGLPFIDSDGDRFSDAYEQTAGTDLNDPSSVPLLQVYVMGFNSLAGYEDGFHPWTTAAPFPLPYTSEQRVIVYSGSPVFLEVESYGGDSVVGLRWNTDDYRYDPQDPSWLLDCGSQTSPWDPTSQACQPSVNVTRVEDPTTLGQWGTLDVPYDSDSFVHWYEIQDPSGAPQEYPAMELRLP